MAEPRDDDDDLVMEYATYLARKPELLAQHAGQWVVIKGARILGVRPTYEEALDLGYGTLGPVAFLVHQILAEEPVAYFPSFGL